MALRRLLVGSALSSDIIAEITAVWGTNKFSSTLNDLLFNNSKYKSLNWFQFNDLLSIGDLHASLFPEYEKPRFTLKSNRTII